MKIALQKDLDPDVGFYYDLQFQIYKEPYLIWCKDMWEEVLAYCIVYIIRINGKCAGDVILDDKGSGRIDIVDFSLLPSYQRRGIGSAVMEQIKEMAKKISAVTRKETLDFFLKSGFLLTITIKDYYTPGVDGYYITFDGSADRRAIR